MTYNPSTILKTDHKMVDKLFKKYEELGNRALAAKRKLVDQLIEEITIHVDMEETLCYPRFKEILDKEEGKMVDEAYVEHAGVKKLLADLTTLEPDQAEFDASVKVLMEQIQHHVKEEEKNLLPSAEKKMSDKDLEAMGMEMMKFKESRGVETN